MKKIILSCVFILTGIVAQAQGTVLYEVEANWEAVSDSNAPLRIEDFAGGPDEFSICGPVLSSAANGCFAAGELQPFFEIRSGINNNVAYEPSNTLLTEPVILVQGVNNGDYLVINFDTSTVNVSRVSFDLFPQQVVNTDTAIIRVFDTTGAFLTTFSAFVAPNEFTFIGIHSTTAIGRIEIADSSQNNTFLITDLRYGITRANDDGARLLIVGEEFDDNDIVSSNVFATDSSVFLPDLVDPSCANYNGADVWFRFTVPANGNITIETDAEPGSALTDTGLSIYDVNANEIECNDDDGNGFFSKISLENRTPGETLFARVWAFDGAQNGEFKISAYSEEVLGINENNLNATISHYPNPTNGVVNFKATSAISSIEVYTILGQKVVSQTVNSVETTIDLSSQPAGMYIANVTTENGTEAIRILKK